MFATSRTHFRTSTLKDAVYLFRLGFVFVLLSLLCLSIPSTVYAQQARANDPLEQEVAQAVHALYKALSNKDAKTFASFLPAEGFTEFNPDWRGVRRLNMSIFEGVFSSGAMIDLGVSDLQVQIAGETAIVSGYRVGTIAAPSSVPVQSRLALSMVWRKESGNWKLQHVHLSPEG